MERGILFTATIKPVYRRLLWSTGVFLVGVAIYTVVDFVDTWDIGRIALLSTPVVIIGIMSILRATRFKIVVYDDRIEQWGTRRKTIPYDQVRSVFLNKNRIDIKVRIGKTISVSKEMELRTEISSYILSKMIERPGVRIWGDPAWIEQMKESHKSNG